MSEFENKVEECSESDSPKFLKALAFGLLISIGSGLLIGLTTLAFGGMWEYILIILLVVSGLVPRGFLNEPHKWKTMLLCCFTSFLYIFTIYLTMEIAGTEFKDAAYINVLMIISPLLGLYLGYIKLKGINK